MTIPLRILAAALLAIPASSAAELNLMPWPSHVDAKPGALALQPLLQFEVSGCDARVTHAVGHLTSQLSARTGLRFGAGAPPLGAPATSIVIHCETTGLATQAVTEDESYHLIIDATAAQLTAPNPLGIIHGVETILQLVRQGEQGWVIPAVAIDDTPRFPWRGLMMDTARHFMPLDVVKRNIDGMAAVKLNVLHLHLSDDEGFRVESLRFPNLHQRGSDGEYYTQAEIRDLVAYARDRGIRIIPEFDVPGHSMDWLAAYPELASNPGTFQISHGWLPNAPGDHSTINPALETTYQLLDGVFGEMAGLFPDAYFHIGGDEVNGKYWDQNPAIQAFMREHSLANNHALQAYFTRRLQAMLTKYGKHMDGWDEILDPSLPKDTLIHSWRGPKQLADAARMGFPTILSADWYLDLMFSTAHHYAVEPLSGDSASLSSAEKARVLGGEACMWAEYVTPEVLDHRLWPRLAAIAERLWSPAATTDVASMYRRLEIVSRNLEWVGLRHRANPRRMLQRLAGDASLEALETLAWAVEPVKSYDRFETQRISTIGPLNRLVDCVPPESDRAREFTALVKRAIQEPGARTELRLWLVRWRDNDARFQVGITQAPMLRELSPLSQQLKALATTGIEALDALEARRSVAPGERAAQLKTIEAAAAPRAELLLVIVPAIRELVQSAPLAK